MKHQKSLNLLDEPSDSRFVIRKLNIGNDQPHANYDERNAIIYNKEVLQWCNCDCDYNDAYVLVRYDITIIGCNEATQVVIVHHSLSVLQFTEYSSNYTDTTDSSWFYSKDEAANFNVDIASNDDFKFLEIKAKLLGDTVTDGANRIFKNTAIAVSLKNLNNFWR